MATPVARTKLAQIKDVELAYEGTIAPEQHAWVATTIDRAARLLISKRPGLRGQVTAGHLDADAVTDVVVSAVLRVIRNPQGYKSEGEGSYLYSLDSSVSSGRLFFTVDELAQVTPARTGSTSAGSIGVGLARGGQRQWV